MTDAELAQAVRSVSVETGSLVCLGCGHEHDCGIHGCAILRQAAERLEILDVETATCYVCGKQETIMRYVCSKCAKTLQPMSCAGCHYEGLDDLEEHMGHCARCIRNRYPRDLYKPKEGRE